VFDFTSIRGPIVLTFPYKSELASKECPKISWTLKGVSNQKLRDNGPHDKIDATILKRDCLGAGGQSNFDCDCFNCKWKNKRK